MNIVVSVVGTQNEGARVTLSLSVSTDTGIQSGGSCVVDFIASTTQINNRIADAARSIVGAQANAKVIIFGGAV